MYARAERAGAAGGCGVSNVSLQGRGSLMRVSLAPVCGAIDPGAGSTRWLGPCFVGLVFLRRQRFSDLGMANTYTRCQLLYYRAGMNEAWIIVVVGEVFVPSDPPPSLALTILMIVCHAMNH